MKRVEFLLRSLMFVPGDNDRLLESASRSHADGLIFDLEDAIQPVENKQIARDKVTGYIKSGVFKNFYVFPRVNSRESGQLLKDVYGLTIEGIDGFVYPKAKAAEDISFFDKLLETIEYEKGFSIGTFKIIPLIETTGAVLNAAEICRASGRVIAIAFGCEDFISDLGGIHDEEGQSIFTARSIIAMAARANNKIPIDTPHIKVHDLVDLEKNLKIAKKLGFEGMLILNPKELPLCHTYFSPGEQEIREAEEIVKSYEEALANNKGTTMLNGKFIDSPLVTAAQKVLKKRALIDRIVSQRHVNTSS